MAGIFNGPARGGTRGGRDQFNWDNVKSDKDREFYLGHSVKALTGRWQKGKDVYWYTRDKDEGSDAEARRQAEMHAVKQREQDLMMEALGLKPKAPKHHVSQPRLDKEDMQRLMARDDEAGGAVQAGAEGDADRVRGLGFNASRTTGAIQAGTDHETMQGVGLGRAAPGGAGPSGSAPAAHLAAAQADEVHRRQHKEEKKAAKRAKKESKRAKKESKRSRRDRGRSRSRSPSSGRDDSGGGRRDHRRRRRSGSPSRRERSRSPRREDRRRRHDSRSRSRSPATRHLGRR